MTTNSATKNLCNFRCRSMEVSRWGFLGSGVVQWSAPYETGARAGSMGVSNRAGAWWRVGWLLGGKRIHPVRNPSCTPRRPGVRTTVVPSGCEARNSRARGVLRVVRVRPRGGDGATAAHRPPHARPHALFFFWGALGLFFCWRRKLAFWKRVS